MRNFFLSFFLSQALFASSVVYAFQSISLKNWKQSGTWLIDEGKLSITKRSSMGYNLCFTKKVDFLNGSISVRFRANSGQIDQGGGLMWRVQDAQNYYVARFNPLEDNFRFYRVQNGYRSEIASLSVSLSEGWHTMKIIQDASEFRGYLDGDNELKAQDDNLNKSGGVGVWSKADALSSFDDLHISSQP
ncbi:hypothetical protein JHD50_12180 [Sulfurimonas sp. MAG313]|nr:hypothetical protein [Sulfurimonas sp. MAG313]MDF1882047.1 hypothetical protein [Sulfurimonas sp. MAG313]